MVSMQYFISLFIFLSLIYVYVYGGPAASCGSSATDPCCNLSMGGNGQALANLATDLNICLNNDCPICCQRIAQDTTSAKQVQQLITDYVYDFNQNQCWGGVIASSPGSSISFFLDYDLFMCSVLKASCSIDNTYLRQPVCSGASFNYKPVAIAMSVVGGFFFLVVCSIGILMWKGKLKWSKYRITTVTINSSSNNQ